MTDYGRFGSTAAENYGSPIYKSDAMGVKGESTNILEWTSDVQEMVEKLFKGTDANGTGKFSKNCQDKKGKVPGIGPNCAKIPEQAQSDMVECYYIMTLDCINSYRSSVYESTARFITTYVETTETRKTADGNDRWGYDVTAFNYTSLELERAKYDEYTAEFDECVSKLEDDCECKQCVTGSYSPPDEDDEDTDVEPVLEVVDDQGMTANYGSLETSSGFTIIPRVWGRYVIGGNIIWIGNQRNILDSVTYDTDTGRVTAQAYENYIDMDVGLCVGEVDGVIRVWMDDLLIYNDILVLDSLGEATTDLQSEAGAPNPFDLSSMAINAPRIRFFAGTSSQKVSEESATQEGFGRSPAYRDLCYMRLENVNLNLFGGKFPELRIEIASLTEADTRFIDSGPETIDAEYLSIEPRTGQLFAISGDDLAIFDWDTLEKTWTTPYDVSTDKLGVLPSGYPLRFTPFATFYEKAVVYDQAFAFREMAVDENTSGDEVAISPHNFKPLLITTSIYNATDKKGVDRVVYTTEADHICYLDYDYTDESLSAHTVESMHVYSGTGTVVENSIYNDETGTYYVQFRVNTTSATALDICKYLIATADGTSDTLITPEDYTLFTIPGVTLWDGETTGIRILQAVSSARDNSIILFIRQDDTETNRIVKLDPSNMSILWSVTCDHRVEPWGRMGAPVSSRSASNDLYFLSTSGQVISLDLSNGDLFYEGNLSDYGWPAYATEGAQYFDGRTASLTYVTTTNKIARIFFDRVNPLRVSLQRIAEDIANGSPLTTNIIDATALSTITIAGYAVTETISVKDFFSEVVDFYQLSVIDDGASIALAPRGDLSYATVLNSDFDIIADTTKRTSLSQGTLPDSVRVSFVTIDNTGLVQNVQELSVRGDDEVTLQAPKTIEFELAVNEDPDIMRLYSEQALIASRSEQATLAAALMPRRLALTTHDPISLNGTVYQITTTFLSPDNKTEVVGARFNIEDFSAQVAVSSASLYNEVAINRVTKAGMYRPVMLFTNALNNGDSLRSTSGRQIAYAGIEAGTPDVPTTRIYLRVPEHEGVIPDRLGASYADEYFTVPPSDLYVSAPVSKAAHFGFLYIPPDSPNIRKQPWTSSVDDYMTVEFAREDTMDLIASLTDHGYPGYPVLENEAENLLIVGQEYIKFGSYTIDDARTVTFTSLVRGYLGTSPYQEHEEGVRVYLYTPDTLQPISINPAYTKRRSRAKIFTSVPAPSGTSQQVFYPVTDAGSARPWPPTAPEVLAKDGDITKLVLRVKRDHPLFFDLLSDGGPILDIWSSNEYYLSEVFSSNRNYNFDVKNFNLAAWQVQTLENDGEPFVDFEIDMPPGVSAKYVLLSQISRDGNGEMIAGHPVQIRVTWGNEDTYPST
jgi:hypothetical protein